MSITYDEAVQRWYDERMFSGYVQPYTATKSREKASYFSKSFGDVEIDDIRPIDISEAMHKMRTKGGRKGNGLSLTTIRAIHLAASQACDWAVNYELAESNPFKKVKRPKAQFRQMGYLDVDDAQRMVSEAIEEMDGETITRSSFLLAIVLALLTGMRRGEIFALTWADVDMGSGRIGVSHAVKGDGTIGKPKSASGVRSVAIGPNVIDVLMAHDAKCHGEYIICDENGERANLNTFEHWWRRWADKHGHKGLRFHELRHSHATALISSGTDVKTVQHRLGHSNANITMSVYAHAIPSADMHAANELDEILFNKKEVRK